MSVDLSNKEIKSHLEFLKEHLPPKPTAVDGLYQLPKNLSDDVVKTNFSQNSLQKISDHLGYFLGILKSIKVNFVEETSDPRWVASSAGVISQNNTSSSVSGLYRVTGYDHSEILLIKKNRYQLKHLLAILAHEYTHHYLYEHRVRKNETYENEILTEIATTFLGIGQFLVEGYYPITWTSDYYNYVFVSGYKTNTITLGYVTPDTIKKAILLATELRHWNPKEVVKSFRSLFDKLSAYIKLIPYRSEYNRVNKEEAHRKKVESELSELVIRYENLQQKYNNFVKNFDSTKIDKRDGESFVSLANEVSTGEVYSEILKLKNNPGLVQIKRLRELSEKVSSWEIIISK